VCIIRLLPVGYPYAHAADSTDDLTATSGACATIASDALMNPFDGKSYRMFS
jgi:hypothetical protein